MAGMTTDRELGADRSTTRVGIILLATPHVDAKALPDDDRVDAGCGFAAGLVAPGATSAEGSVLGCPATDYWM